MKWFTTFILLATIITSQADQLYLLDNKGKEQGPFELKSGKKIAINDSKVAVSRIVTEKQHKLIEKMSKIIIPKLKFKNESIVDVVEFLNEASIKHDKTGKGINFLLDIDEHKKKDEDEYDEEADPFFVAKTKLPKNEPLTKKPSITCSLRDIPLLEVINIFTDACDLKYQLTDNSVIICAKNKPYGPIVIRMFDVMGTFAERISTIQPYFRDNSIDEDEGNLWKSLFEEMGVQWPAGSSIRYVPSIGKLIVANTKVNMLKLENVLLTLNVIPTQIEIEVQFLEFDKDVIEEVAKKRITVEVLTELWKKKRGRLLAAPVIVTQAGVEAMIKGVTEYIYPTEYTPYRKHSSSNKTTVVCGGIVEPSGFETREVGVILSVLPEITSDGQMMMITMTPEMVTDPQWEEFGITYKNAKAEVLSHTIKQPFFETTTFSTSISAKPGAKILISGGAPSRDKKTFIYGILTARLIDIEGNEVKPPDLNLEYELP